MFQIFNYLKVNRKFIPSKLGFDDLEQTPYIFPIKSTSAEKKEWMNFYPDTEDIFTNRTMEPFSRKVIIRLYVDKNHARNLLNRRSHCLRIN